MKKNLFRVLWAIGFLANLFFISRWLMGDQLLIVRMANYFLPWIGLGLLGFLMLALGARKRRLSILLTLPVIVISMNYVPLMLRCGVNSFTEGTRLKVMSYNIWRDNQDMIAAAEIIRREEPDILLLQEVTSNQLEILIAVLNSLDRGKKLDFLHDPINLAAIGSTFSIKKSDSLPQKNRSQKAQLETPFGPLTVINIHGVRTGWSIRHKGMEDLLREDVQSEEGPLILAGDFNTNEQSQTFKLIERYLANTHNEAGCGFGFTFPANSYSIPFWPNKLLAFPPLIRIDHIFHSGHFTALTACTLEDSGGSDHLPIIAELALVKPKLI
jgi:vancomycin resistance protein VanJ